MRPTVLLLLALAGITDALRVGRIGATARPRSRVVVAATGLPSAKWTLAQIREFIAENGLDIKTGGKGRTKAFIVNEIQNILGGAGASPEVSESKAKVGADLEATVDKVEEVEEAAAATKGELEATAAAEAAEAAAQVEAETAARAQAEAAAAEALEAAAIAEAEAVEAAQVAATSAATANEAAAAKEEVPEFWRRKDWRQKANRSRIGSGDTVPGFQYTGDPSQGGTR